MMVGACMPPSHVHNGPQHDTWANNPKDGVAAPWQILDVVLFWVFLLTPNEFWPEAGAIGSSLKLSFRPYKERPIRTPYAAWASFLVCAALGLRDELELYLGLHLGDSISIWKSMLVSSVSMTFSKCGRTHGGHVLIIHSRNTWRRRVF